MSIGKQNLSRYHQIVAGLKSLAQSPLNIMLSLVALLLIYYALVPLTKWALLQATFFGADKALCNDHGACWPFISARIKTILVGFYPREQLWRVYIYLALSFLLSIWVLKTKQILAWVSAFIIYTIIIVFILHGGFFGLEMVATEAWGGLLLTFIIASLALVVAFPIALLLALGRRSNLSIFRIISITWIELIRGVPLISILFMASVMLPLFLPSQLELDKLARAIIGIIIFQAAYLAEVVRGGLQALPNGQYEACDSLALSYWQSMRLVILPQALTLAIPGIVNTFIALFKDTTLVLIIGLFDFLGIIQSATNDTEWLGFATEAYVFCAFIYFVICFSMSKYSQAIERKYHWGLK